LQEKLGRGTIITFSFSTIDEKIASIFEPGAISPSLRLEALKTVKEKGFLSGISMMPMIPYVSDLGAHLEELFSTFTGLSVDYILPATITLFGHQASDSRTLVFRAIEKHYPELLPKYQKLFKDGAELPAYYRNAFHRKMKELAQKYEVRDRII